MSTVYFPFFVPSGPQVMSGTYITDVADAVVADLNAINWAALVPSSFVPSYTAERLYVPIKNDEELASSDELTVLVRSPIEDEFLLDAISGEETSEEVVVAVGVIQHLPDSVDFENPATCKPLDVLVALTRFMGMIYDCGDTAGPGIWFETKIVPYREEYLRMHRCYFGEIHFKFKMQVEYDSTQ